MVEGYPPPPPEKSPHFSPWLKSGGSKCIIISWQRLTGGSSVSSVSRSVSRRVLFSCSVNQKFCQLVCQSVKSVSRRMRPSYGQTALQSAWLHDCLRLLSSFSNAVARQHSGKPFQSVSHLLQCDGERTRGSVSFEVCLASYQQPH